MRPWGEVKTSKSSSRSTTDAILEGNLTFTRLELGPSIKSACTWAFRGLPKPSGMTDEEFEERKLKVDKHVRDMIDLALDDLNTEPGFPLTLISGKVDAKASNSEFTIDVRIEGSGHHQRTHRIATEYRAS